MIGGVVLLARGASFSSPRGFFGALSAGAIDGQLTSRAKSRFLSIEKKHRYISVETRHVSFRCYSYLKFGAPFL